METYGRYQFLTKLATGGMAQVFLARERGLEGFDRLVVLKRILPHLAENEEFVRMFLQEARVAARLNHPNIAGIYDVGKEGESYYIVMEYVHGEDFRRVVRQANREGRILPVPLACRMVIGACAGLEFAHARLDEQGKPLGIVHRDISPQNLLITFEGAVKVIDFGIAKAADSANHTKTGVLKGKYSYMSPEQADGKRVDRRSDVFALGIVLYELVTHQRLFKRQSDLSTIQAVMACKVKPPSDVNPAVDKELEAIILRVLTKDRDARTATAGQLQQELEEYLARHQLPGSTAHLKQFMREAYAERLALEAKLGHPYYEEEPSPTAKPTPSGSFDFDRAPQRPPPLPPPVAGLDEPGDPGRSRGALTPVLPRPDERRADERRPPAVELAPMPRRPAPLVVPPPLSPSVQDGELSSVSRVVRQVRSRRALAVTFVLTVAVLGVTAAVFLGRTGAFSMPGRHAQLRVQSDPPGAELFLDGQPAGQTTPATVPVEPGRPHELRLEKSGFAPTTDALPAFAGELARSYTLAARAVGAVSVTTSPPGASIVLDGHTLDRPTPAMLADLVPTRDHELVLSLAGYEDEVVTVSVRPGRTTSVAKALRPRPGTNARSPAPPGPATDGRDKDREREPAASGDAVLQVVTVPAGLAVEVDGRPWGATPANRKLPAGRHEVRFVDADRFFEQAMTVMLAAGQTEKVERAFVPRRVRFNVTPYAEVYIRDRKFADSPGDAELVPGTYRFTYTCPEIRARHTETVTIPAAAGIFQVNLALKEGEGAE